jgi:hypothetical protein
LLLLAPKLVLASGLTTPRGPSAVRVLAARHVVQAVVTASHPKLEVLRAGAAVDVLHAASDLLIAGVSRRWRCAAATDAVAASAFAAAAEGGARVTSGVHRGGDRPVGSTTPSPATRATSGHRRRRAPVDHRGDPSRPGQRHPRCAGAHAAAQPRHHHRGRLGARLPGIPLQAAYCGAKHAIKGFTESVNTQHNHEGSAVRVCMVQLPGINTMQFDWDDKRQRVRAAPASGAADLPTPNATLRHPPPH